MSSSLRRRLIGALGATPVAAALPACIGLREAPAHIHYRLDDHAVAQRAAGGTRNPRTLLVAGVAASAFDDGTGIAFSRAPGARAHYQFASWSERPAGRIARLLVHRLAASEAFGDVASATAAVRGDWLLELQLEQMFHDDVSPPGVARIEVSAELLDWAGRRAIGRRRFVQQEPLAGESAVQAVAAFNRALARLLDEVQAWVLAQAARTSA